MEQKRIDPIKTSEHIRETYLRYLNTTFGLKHLELAEQFREIAWQSEGLFRGPILEVAPKYKKGRCLLDLIDEGILSPEFLDYAPGLPKERVEKSLDLNRELYVHQEQALRKIIGKNRNVVIATGTGSGKTECFLFPIIDYLLKERVAGRLGPGIRALLVYPMNALANDQVTRLRHLLPPETGITFGRYTGQTPSGYSQGLEAFKQENAGVVPQSNEMFCRNQILGTNPLKAEWPHEDVAPFVGPPHVLLTNFAMLEYLLMRPHDSVLFDGDAGNSWRFLVLDEAHVYSGAKGTEIGYLVRRLKDRVCRSRSGRLLCIATSATIGANDDESRETIASSFCNLFGERFETGDIVNAEQDTLDTFLSGFGEWGTGGQEFYDALRSCMDSNSSTVEALMQVAREALIPTEHVSRLSDWPSPELVHQALEKISEYRECEVAKEILLFCLLAGDARVRILIGLYEGHPIQFQRAAKRVWETSVDAESRNKSLALLIDLASKARLDTNQPPLLTARYHFFVRSLEGLSICLAKSGSGAFGRARLLLGRHREVPDASGGTAVAFELQACSRCGQHFLRGHLMADGRLVSYPQTTRLGEEPKRNNYFVIDLDEVIESPEDEDPLRDEVPPVSGEEEDEDETTQAAKGGSTQLGDVQYLCVNCGFVTDTDALSCEYCRRQLSKDSREWVTVRKVVPANGSVVKMCPGCGARKYSGGSIIRAFSAGDDASGAVLAHSLMTNIPPTSEMVSEQQEIPEEVRSRFRRSAQATGARHWSQGKRRLLAFSDSRQDAAYFSTYLNRTTHQILHRQLILRAIRRLLRDNSGISEFDVYDLATPLIAEAQSVGLFGAGDTEIGKRTEGHKWLNAELAGTQRRYGLEGVGLISWEIKGRDKLLSLTKVVEADLQEDYGLNAREFVDLLEIFLSELRRQNVLQPLRNVDIRDTYFWPRNRPYTMVENHVNGKLSIASWHPQSTRNMRSDFLERLFFRIGMSLTQKTRNKLLGELWDLGRDQESNIWEEIPSVNALWGRKGTDGAAWRIRSNAWLCRFHTVEDSIYKCNRCGTVSHLSLRSVCPTYRCTGTLESISPIEEFSTNHYRSLYEHSSPIPIETKEHTAQITTQEGAERQRQFSDDTNSLNILSCSTTFELGVDVGQLHAVFLRNVPPTIANYVQRAGRAGRRWGSAAYVLTFCRSRSHDLGYYDATERLVAGKVQPPRITIDNTRIARRHLHAVALSRFWRFRHPEMFNGPEDKRRGAVQWFFFGEPDTGAQRVYAWLETKPQELEEEILRVFPNSMVRGFGSWNWVTDLVRLPEDGAADAWEGSLGLAQTELRTELAAYERLQQDRPQLFNYAKNQLRRIRERQILGVLASRNVLPKYGFPVDVVPLKLQSQDDWAQRVELDRDLRIALSEYAPGCTLVANGKVIASYALERIPGKAWPEYRFAICGQCGKFHRSSAAQDEPLSVCDECGQSLKKKAGTELEGTFVVPIFGFRTSLSEDGQEPVEVRPQRTYSTRVFFSHYRVVPQEPFLPEGSPVLRAGIQIQKRYSRYGMLTIINPGRQKRGFWLCSFCGYGQTVASGKLVRHKSPWGKPCDGKLRHVFLGHEFQSDVLELRFMGPAVYETNQGFWLSLTAALLAGAARALDIERDDIDGTVLQFGGGEYRSLVLFDNVPGGAGHVRLIANKLREVLQAAFEVTENCPGCSRDQSCNACLRNFRNQYAHDLLKRGPVADFLRKSLTGLYGSGDRDGYMPLGLTDGGRWLEQQIRRTNALDLVLDTIPAFTHERISGRDWYRLLQEVGWRGTAVRLFLRPDVNGSLKTGGPQAKADLHAITALTQLPNFHIYTLAEQQAQPGAQLYIRIESEAYAVRWPSDWNPFIQAGEVEFSTEPQTTASVKAGFDELVTDNTTVLWDVERLETLLQGTKVVSIPKGTRQSWKDILTPFIPDRVQSVEIYDRYIRNPYQFRSLDLFLDALSPHASADGISVKVITTCEAEKRDEVMKAFRKTQQRADDQGIKLTYDIQASTNEMPHFRRVQLRSNGEVCSLWLDRGLDIFRFDSLSKPIFQTLETYVVVER